MTRLQPLGEEVADSVEREGGRLDRSDARDETVEHPHPHLQPGIDTSCDGTLDVSQRIIEQDFVVADVYTDRGQS
jgi:hypothetical protein